MYATIQLRGEVSPSGESIDGKPNSRFQTDLVPAFVTLTWIALSGLTVHAASRENLNLTHLPTTAALPECSHLSGWTHDASLGQHCLTELNQLLRRTFAIGKRGRGKLFKDFRNLFDIAGGRLSRREGVTHHT